MADLLKNAKQFGSDLMKDIAHFPRTTGSWPALKQSAIEFYTETKSDLFFFRKDSLNPALTDVVTRIDAALKSDHTAEKADSLLALKTEASKKLNGIGNNQHKKASIAMFGGLAASLFIAAPLFGATALTVVLLTGMAAGFKYITNEAAATSKVTPLTHKIDREILGMADGEGRAALFNSPAFQQSLVDKGLLKKIFRGASWGASKDADYDAIAAKAAVAAKPAQAPEAPKA